MMGVPARDDLSGHALRRASQRGINRADIETVFSFGRCVHARSAWIYVVGRAEVRVAQRNGVDLRPIEGIHVIVRPGAEVMTVYRNHALNLRPSRRRRLRY